MDIDRQYFKKYAGSGKDYAKVFRDHSSIDSCIDLFGSPEAPHVRSMAVLGTATGLVLELIHRRMGILPYGCEISPWAFEQIKDPYHRRVELMDMREYLKVCRKFDLIFSNSLMYLPKKDVLPVLKDAAKKCRYFHYEGSYTGLACSDPYRRTLRTRDWWRTQFLEAGFRELTTVWEKPTYLWKSNVDE